ncbi:chemotaxis protein CheW [Thalassotalea atypica]|uniref:chemotaxis protein CheW n=1 Tax=Thalassotalea atypica TaxID=2054316 RepID=UPI0025744270|nr:chemotaxis protein CheW [Thalassotalea atypica]
MSKPLAASQKVMRSYLSELLTDDEKVQHKEPENKPLEKLLENVSVERKLPIDNKVLSRKPAVEITRDKIEPKVVEKTNVEPAKPIAKAQLQTKKSLGSIKVKPEKDYRNGSFQAMFFKVAGLTIAVPLIELGGIHNVDKATPLMGKPDWFKGVMVQREEQINVVDTARWVMPEKCNDKLLSALDYQYIIMLSTSQWGLTAEHLVDTVTLEQEDVKWLDESNKRPWLAGLVKDRMCALLEVESLIKLLDDGASIHQD